MPPRQDARYRAEIPQAPVRTGADEHLVHPHVGERRGRLHVVHLRRHGDLWPERSEIHVQRAHIPRAVADGEPLRHGIAGERLANGRDEAGLGANLGGH